MGKPGFCSSSQEQHEAIEQRSGMPEWVLSQVPAGEGLVLWGYGGAQGQSYTRDGGGRGTGREGGAGFLAHVTDVPRAILLVDIFSLDVPSLD